MIIMFMEGEREKFVEVQKELLLEKVNAALQELGSTARWLKTPELVEGGEALRDKIIVMVDDIKDVLEAFAPHLIVATDGKASFIQYRGERLEELLNEILARNPNIVLLDYHLSDQLKGTAVARALREAGFKGDSIGFSSDKNAVGEFDKVGAGFLEKNAWDPETSVKSLAESVGKKEKSK